MNSFIVKEKATELGADICGIAGAERFGDAPRGFQPADVLPSCKSVIVFGCRFNASLMDAVSTSPYTVARNAMAENLNQIASKLALKIADDGFDAVPIGSIGPNEYDPVAGKTMGTISLKHAAVLCGLGKMGRNTLLLNDRFGNLLWLAAVLTSAQLEADPIADYDPCGECGQCIQCCPVDALDGVSINQTACRTYAFGERNGAGWKIHCFTCRKVCPNYLGSRGR